MEMKKSPWIIWVGGFFLVSLDQILKYLARTTPHTQVYLIKDWLGWEYFENTGIALSLPLPQWVVLFSTPIILVLVIYLLHTTSSLRAQTGFTLILLGALSNYIDRLLFQKTIDYIRIVTGIINIADILIVIGILYLAFPKKTDYRT